MESSHSMFAEMAKDIRELFFSPASCGWFNKVATALGNDPAQKAFLLAKPDIRKFGTFKGFEEDRANLVTDVASEVVVQTPPLASEGRRSDLEPLAAKYKVSIAFVRAVERELRRRAKWPYVHLDPLAEADVAILLVEHPAEGDSFPLGIPARLCLELLPGGTGEMSPHPSMTFIDVDERWSHALHTAFSHSRQSPKWSHAEERGACDVQWRVLLHDVSFSSLVGSSAGAAARLAFDALVNTDKFGPHRSDLNRVAFVATINEAGQFGPVASKTLPAKLREGISKSLPRIHTFVVARKQEKELRSLGLSQQDELESSKVLFADHYDEAIESLRERLKERRDSVWRTPGPPAISGLVDRTALKEPLFEILGKTRKRFYAGLLDRFSKRPPRTCVLYGPSGYGKTKLAGTIFHSWGKRRTWIDADLPLKQEEEPDSDSRHLIVIDGIDSVGAAWLDANARLCDKPNPILFVTSKYEIKESIKKVRCCRCLERYRDIDLSGFDKSEALEFVKSRLSLSLIEFFSQEMIGRVNEAIDGCPFAWQLLIDIVNKGKGDCFDLFSARSSAEEDGALFNHIFERWFDYLPTLSSTSRSALVAMTCVSMLGTNLNALAFLVGRPEKELEDCLDPWMSKGFIQCRTDGSIVPHALLRSACLRLKDKLLGNPGADNKKQSTVTSVEHLTTRYQAYLDEQLAKETIASVDAFSVLDAWLVTLREAFNYPTGRLEEFAKRYNAVTGRLDPFLERGSIVSQHRAWLSSFFQDQGMKLKCYEVLPLAQVIRKLKPRRADFGYIVWNTTSPAAKGDEWSLAEIISAACLQFCEQGAETAQDGLRKAMEVYDRWTKLAETNQYYFDHERKENRYFKESDEMLMPALIGLCFGGVECLLLCETGTRFSVNDRLWSRYPLAALALILFASERKDRRVVQEIIHFCWRIIPPNDVSILAAVYLRSGGFKVPSMNQYINSTEDFIEIDMMLSRVAARLAYADRFLAFITKETNGPRGKNGTMKLRRSEI